MRIIEAVVFEPVGCLAEFRAKEFNEIAANLFDLDGTAGNSGSRAYWQLLDLIERSGRALSARETAMAEGLELQAVERVDLYEDAAPAISRLKAMGIKLLIASSLSAVAVTRFLDRFSLNDSFSAVWTRDNAGGVREDPLAKAIEGGSFRPDQVMSLVDTADGIEVAKATGANSMLMINDYDEGRRLAMLAPTGGIVSLDELPDAIRLVAESANRQLARE
jgi:phosphoglycolate phosphatase-like HAD superfamily hydrolase